MTTATRNLLARWMLLAFVVLALVIMHHTPARHPSSEEAHAAPSVAAVMDTDTMSVARPATDDTGMAAMLHQCLAVFVQVAAGVLLLLTAAVFVRMTAGSRSAVRSLMRCGPDPPSEGAGRKILTTVCVLRL